MTLNSIAKKSIIFLDVDGVLNSTQDAMDFISSERLDLIRHLLESKKNTRLVISSNWLQTDDGLFLLNEYLFKANLTKYVLDKIPSRSETYLYFYNNLPKMSDYQHKREKRIEYWLLLNQAYVDSVLILDDLNLNFQNHLKNHFLKIKNGIEESHIEKALNILNQKYIHIIQET